MNIQKGGHVSTPSVPFISEITQQISVKLGLEVVSKVFMWI